jgi:hypothetical protein
VAAGEEEAVEVNVAQPRPGSVREERQPGGRGDRAGSNPLAARPTEEIVESAVDHPKGNRMNLSPTTGS